MSTSKAYARSGEHLVEILDEARRELGPSPSLDLLRQLLLEDREQGGGLQSAVAETATDDPTELEWLNALARNPAFGFLADPAEDIYSLSDGIPFRDEA